MSGSPDRSTRTPRPGSVGLLERPMTRLVGKCTTAQLAKQGVETGADLPRLLPRRYDTWGELTDMRTLVEGKQATIQAQVVRASSRRTRSGRVPALMEAAVTDGASTMNLVQLGVTGQMRVRAAQLVPGTTVLLSGKVGFHRERKQLSNPRLYILDGLNEDEYAALLARPVPIYPGTGTPPSWSVAKAVRSVLDQLEPGDVAGPLPEELRREAELVDVHTAYRWVHRPEDSGQWKATRKRLRHGKTLILQVVLAQRRVHHEATCTAVAWPVPEEEGSLRADLDAHLPYDLTAEQKRVGKEISADLAHTVPMRRLLQGDVGSGKTLVALHAMPQVVGGGGQAVLLAPTEILTAQHHSSLEAVLGPMARLGMLGNAERTTRVHLLTGSTPAAQRHRILTDLVTGEPVIVVGTHALLSDTVQIPFLGLVVADEQHRFGVAQRDALREHGGLTDPATGQTHTPHLLVMTVTPIPHAIAMMVFGDLIISVPDELPAGRSVIPTHLVSWSCTFWVEGIWRRAAKEVASGGRAYVVYLRIEVDDEPRHTPMDGAVAVETDDGPKQEALAGEGGGSHPDRPLAVVEDWRQWLAGEPALGGVGVGVLTGRMSDEDKTAAMADFASGNTLVLVSTTVIEVGVDVPEVSMMVILGAERFGLSQLHQLRGWVGRGSRPSLCVAVTGAKVGSIAFYRFEASASTTDGFALVEADLELRSEGDVLGTSQSGRISGLDSLRATRDTRLIATARRQAERIVTADPQLSDHRALAAVIIERLGEESQVFLERA